ncbi:MAG: long-chain fatty acid--CoA ligase [Rothia sp. (in: high G+C Gram-positive bacteria)]|uniref:long-chain fatty acid--CoA ligase n=1 Tax=Rothia sp. (in: high G+C Gram-positive bacteria) TaxID=1885016 RepID=UPI0026DB0EB0|nr:long-chain fatty acid--CoA ligase [Rothia sp. (in: high G+C Gram-positive bacteria)]MDO4884792.1 long-chain fatty acid--CoA ligase [Rothia sp. (in: high G+C Gram-positive bacteria)]
MGEQRRDGSEASKPEVTNPANLAPVDPQQPREKREDIRAAIFETKLRRWALIGFVGAGALFWAVTFLLQR